MKEMELRMNKNKQLHAQSVVYHIYPLGYAGLINESDTQNKTADISICPLKQITEDLERLQKLGITMLYIGPVFSSEHHGYDTKDYTRIDERLGRNDDFKDLVLNAHRLGIRVILDTVFNHVGRSFPYFEDVRIHKQASIRNNFV